MPVTRGTSNSNERGSSYDRRRRKLWMLDHFGDGTHVPCYRCWITLTYETLTVDRRIPGVCGGRYTRDNILPACGPCNSSHGGGLATLPKPWRTAS